MAIKSITESWENRTVDETAQARTTVRTFTVEFDEGDNPLARPIMALSHYQIPPRGGQHPYDRNMYVVGRNVLPAEGPLVYVVTCNYSSIGYSSRNKTGNPLKQKPQVSWTFATSNEPIDRDIYGKPITNSSGDSFDPPITMDKHDIVLRYVRNERTFDQRIALKYIEKINSDTFIGIEPLMALCTVFEAEKIYDEDYGVYYRVSYEFQFRMEEVDTIEGRKKGWIRKILDQGYNAKNSEGDYVKIKIKDGSGLKEEISQPVLLDGHGKVYDGYNEGLDVILAPPEERTNRGGVYLPFELYQKVSFSPLNIRI